MTKNAPYDLSEQDFAIVKCKCGYKILLVPDLKAMGQAIESHVLEHLSKDSLTEQEADRIRMDLIAKTMRKAADQTIAG